ncbi:MAG: hypothetical protein HW420_753 [Candidatus Nitrosotenuis sp.]|nr:hypothetical protein [Candidatus Nitrosotenuis sp.]
MDPIFIIGIVFLVMASSIGAYVVYHKEVVMKPLILGERAEIADASCDEIKKKHELGQYWALSNYRLAAAKISACFPEK